MTAWLRTVGIPELQIDEDGLAIIACCLCGFMITVFLIWYAMTVGPQTAYHRRDKKRNTKQPGEETSSLLGTPALTEE